MKANKKKTNRKAEFTYRFFSGERELSELSPEERASFGARLTERMGAALNAWFTTHPEEYKSI